MHLKGDTFATDEPIPWGDDAVITLGFQSDTNKYTLQGADGRFLSASGALVEDPVAEAQYRLELVRGMVAFQAHNGNYLTSVGGEGLCKATKPGPPTANELYVFEDSQPQIKMTAAHGKKVSIFTGALQANQTQTTDTEQFQLEIGPDGTWAFRTHTNTFWYLDGAGAVQADGVSKETPESRFKIEWQSDRIAIKASNGCYVEAKKSGAMVAVATAVAPATTFVYEMTNRPRLVLRTIYGFINTVAASGNLMCNKALPEVLSMHVRAGRCEIKSNNGKYWAPTSDLSKIGATSDTPTNLFLEFVDLSKFAIVFETEGGDRRYLKVHSSGAVSVTGTVIEPETMFEY
jgi:fascin 1/2